MGKEIDIQEIVDLLSYESGRLDEIYLKVLLFFAKVTDSDIASLYIPDNISQKGLELKCYIIKEKDNFRPIKKENYYLPFNEGIVGWVYRNRSVYVTNNTKSDSFYIPLEVRKGSNIAIPIISKDGQILCIINLEDSKENKYTEEDIKSINFIIPIVSTIISHHKIIEKANYENKMFKLLYSINRISEGFEDLDEMFNKLANFLVSELNVYRGMIFLIDEESKNLKIVKSIGLTDEEANRGVYNIGEGIVGTVALTKTKISVTNIWEDKRFMNKTRARRSKSKKISFFANPIIYKDSVLGVIATEKEFLSLSDFEITERIMEEISQTIAVSVWKYTKLREEKEKLMNENILLREQLHKTYSIGGIVVGKSEKMIKILDIINSIAKTNSTVLIEGESGTGKELIAKAIHYESNRKDGPFIAINCAAIPETLLESELFGYKKGSFTGAISDKKGKILLSDGGTLFLDEIGDMPLNLQAKLLRVLQNKEVEPIGGTPVKVNMRVIAATNKNLEELVSQGKFRSDLYYRLNVIKIELPPLRERIQDIPLLVDFFIKKFSEEHSKKIKYVDSKVIDLLMLYDWPGNIRELENVIERMVLFSQNGTITDDLLPKYVKETKKPKLSYEDEIREIVANYIYKIDISKENNLYDKMISPLVRTLINLVMTKSKNKKTKASKILGINRTTLLSYIRKYNID
ncbi:MAG: sigma 54-interacting transcriptional regulator [Brevinematia bacterium]